MTSKRLGEDKTKLEVPPDYLVAAQAALTVEQRIALARTEGARPSDATLGEADIALRRYILNIIAKDAEQRVRQALAATLAGNSSAPRDVALALANDIDLVALPMLRLSEVLTSEDLTAIINSQSGGMKLGAIAERREVSPEMCLALIARGDEDTADRLLRNPGAAIPETGLHAIVDQYGDRTRIQLGLIDRAALPATLLERIVSLVSSELLTRLVDRHALSADVASKVALDVRDRATVGMASRLSREALDKLVAQLIAEGRLTQSLLLRSLCVGNLDLIVHTIAMRCRLAADYVRARLMRGIPEQLKELWWGAALPFNLLPVARAVIDILNASDSDSEKWDAAYYQHQIIQRLVTVVDDMDVEFTDEDVAYIVSTFDAGSNKLEDFVSDDTTRNG